MHSVNLASGAERNSDANLVWEEKLSNFSGQFYVPKFSSFRVRAVTAGTKVYINNTLAATMAVNETIVFNAGPNATLNNKVLIKIGELETASTLTIQDITWTATPGRGIAGDAITVEYVDTLAGGLTVTEVAGVITVDFGGDTPTALQIKDAFSYVYVIPVIADNKEQEVQTAPVVLANLAGGANAAAVAYMQMAKEI